MSETKQKIVPKYEVKTVATDTAEVIVDKDDNSVSERALLVEIKQDLEEIKKMLG